MLTSLYDLKKISEEINLEDFEKYSFLGLRVVNEDCDGFDLLPGSDCPTCYVWDDGEWTDEELDGTCCISTKYLQGRESFWPGGYSGRRVWLVGGNYATDGADDGELIVFEAQLLQVFDI